MHLSIARLVQTALGLAVSIGLSCAALAFPFTGPISPYYLNNIGDQTIYVVRGTSVINSFAWHYAPGCDNACEAVLAISHGHIATNWIGLGFAGSPGTAGQYNVNGTPTGVSWPNSSPPPGTDLELIVDGTSDGVHNYSVQNLTDPGTTNVVSYDLQWQNPTSLFEVPIGYAGITYDPVDNALWVSTANPLDPGANEESTISEYSLTGTLLTSFTTVVPNVYALAYDPADNTLWFSAQSNDGTTFLIQYSKTGDGLQLIHPTGLPDGDYFSGEILIPEPGSLALLCTGLAAGWWFAARWRNRLSARATQSLEPLHRASGTHPAMVYHGVTPATPIDPARSAYRDVLVATFRRE